MTNATGPDLGAAIRTRALELGFAHVGITPAARPDTLEYFRDWLQQGFYGEMNYLPRRESAYEHPQGVQVGVRSIIITAMNYGSGLQRPAGSGKIGAYAQGTADYHHVLREKLGELADALHTLHPAARTRIAIDTAPLLERDVARKAGLGWFGKNTMLINKREGSYFFLGAILTDVELPADSPHVTDHCGTCTRCLEACPTSAFQEPHVLDASRCISYLTIELRDRPIPVNLRQGMGEWLFGCDVCQQVCPWNRKVGPGENSLFQPVPEKLPQLVELLSISEQEFQLRYGQTPFARPGRVGMARNAAIVMGNSGDLQHCSPLITALNDPSSLVRGAAAWALGELGGAPSLLALQSLLEREEDSVVLEEIRRGIQRCGE